MKLVEHWRWRHTSAETGVVTCTEYLLSADEAQRRFRHAQPVEGSMQLIDVEHPSFAETTPHAFYAPSAMSPLTTSS